MVVKRSAISQTDRFALADLGQQDRLDEIVTDAARGLEDTFDVNERSNTSTGKSTDGDLHDLGLRWASENTSPSWRHDTTGRKQQAAFQVAPVIF
uniref:hypothetical protein n=1 Tax=Gammaproteobacteria TaxID=1236 RepID=UPI000D25C056|nr:MULTISPECIES: hypothetical protein [Gammaproteobacteria]